VSKGSWASKKINQILGFIAKISFKISQFPPRVKQEMPNDKERKKTNFLLPHTKNPAPSL
jgi:hypothetical protein